MILTYYHQLLIIRFLKSYILAESINNVNIDCELKNKILEKLEKIALSTDFIIQNIE